jgi:uncharacterized protein (DUF2062 family)
MPKIPSFRSLLKQVLHLRESPQRTALAFAIGVFICFSPAYGLHTAMVFFFAWALRLNLLSLMAGAFLNNPWTVVPILGGTYWVGALLLGRSDNPSFDWQDMSFSAIYEQVMPYAMPFFLGGMVLSLLGAALAYPLAYFFVSKYRQAHPLAQTEPLPPSQDVG